MVGKVKVRKDLLKENLSVPIGDNLFYGGKRFLRYRFLSNDVFQVYYKNSWRNAESIDFDFK
jgi:hypothetical protein